MPNRAIKHETNLAPWKNLVNMEAAPIYLLTVFRAPAIFAGAFLFGETVILTAAFLAAQGLWSLAEVFWLSLAGTVVSDAIWFLFGQRILLFSRKWDRHREQGTRLLVALEGITGRRPFLSLLFIKFLYGTRILTILYLSMRKIGFLIFVVFDTAGTVLWLAVVMAVGWLAGKSIINLVPFLNRFEFAALFLILILIVFRSVTVWLSKKIAKR